MGPHCSCLKSYKPWSLNMTRPPGRSAWRTGSYVKGCRRLTKPTCNGKSAGNLASLPGYGGHDEPDAL